MRLRRLSLLPSVRVREEGGREEERRRRGSRPEPDPSSTTEQACVRDGWARRKSDRTKDAGHTAHLEGNKMTAWHQNAMTAHRLPSFRDSLHVFELKASSTVHISSLTILPPVSPPSSAPTPCLPPADCSTLELTQSPPRRRRNPVKHRHAVGHGLSGHWNGA